MAQARRRSDSGATVDLTIERIGGRGDGIAEFRGRPVYVPFTVPGDRIKARLEGRRGEGQAASLVDIVEAGPNRRDPDCAHFGVCGGCALQHLDHGAYKGWVQERVAVALANQGLGAVPVATPILTPPGGRRRAILAARRVGDGVVLGFHERRRHRIVDVRHCPVLRPDLAALLPALRDLLVRIVGPGDGAEVALAALDGGIDVTFGAAGEPDLELREGLAAFAESNDLARLSWRCRDGPAEPVAQRHSCTLAFGGVPVAVPPGSFLQASAEGEAALCNLVVAAAKDARRVADLFAGLGTFSFPLAKLAAVRAIDSDADAMAALQAAANRAGLAGRVTAETRNLFRDPVTAEELDGYDAVVFDPPRAGAAAQATAARPVRRAGGGRGVLQSGQLRPRRRQPGRPWL